MCNTYGCNGEMRPLRKMWNLDGEIKNSTHRMFKCTVCGKENPWLDKPVLNGTAGEFHCMGLGLASGLSLMSDPVFCPPKAPSLLSRRRRR
jgi:hypothetical protein